MRIIFKDNFVVTGKTYKEIVTKLRGHNLNIDKTDDNSTYMSLFKRRVLIAYGVLIDVSSEKDFLHSLERHKIIKFI